MEAPFHPTLDSFHDYIYLSILKNFAGSLASAKAVWSRLCECYLRRSRKHEDQSSPDGEGVICAAGLYENKISVDKRFPSTESNENVFLQSTDVAKNLLLLP